MGKKKRGPKMSRETQAWIRKVEQVRRTTKINGDPIEKTHDPHPHAVAPPVPQIPEGKEHLYEQSQVRPFSGAASRRYHRRKNSAYKRMR